MARTLTEAEILFNTMQDILSRHRKSRTYLHQHQGVEVVPQAQVPVAHIETFCCMVEDWNEDVEPGFIAREIRKHLIDPYTQMLALSLEPASPPLEADDE